jgi:sulfate adenylyltransferase (ADP) / ATP adenylyltransferase
MIRGSLWERVVATSQHALSAGILVPVPTDTAYIEERGVRFFVRVLAGLRRKDEARKKQEAESERGKRANPFLPPEKDLTVAELTGTHLAVLNKFNVVENHLLIVTRAFEDQDMLLTLPDFEALWLCMAEYNSLGFYNGGREAGASQQHKHLQLVPLPLAPEGPEVPVGPMIARAPEGMGTVPGFPFLHSFVRLGGDLTGSPIKAAGKAFELYRTMLSGAGMTAPPLTGSARQSLPYCLLVTRDWMLLVPRSREFFDDISFNSLAFAGSFFVRNEQQLERLRTTGPLNALAAVSFPKNCSS